MDFKYKKIENCFADSQTYEYQIPIVAEEFLALLDDSWESRRNMKLRRPVFVSEKGSIHIKGVLAGNLLRVSFKNDSWQREKELFEEFLVKVL